MMTQVKGKHNGSILCGILGEDGVSFVVVIVVSRCPFLETMSGT